MAWTEITRANHDRSAMRYASDCTDEEWAVVAPFLSKTSKVGRSGKHSMRTLWEATQYIAANSCQWRALPTDFPPFTTGQHQFYRWRDSGLIVLINEALVAASRLIGGRTEAPTACIIGQPIGQNHRERRTARLRRRQKDQWPQASYCHRYAGKCAGRPGS